MTEMGMGVGVIGKIGSISGCLWSQITGSLLLPKKATGPTVL